MSGIERWAPIKGFEKLYSVSDRGRVWAHDRIVRRVHTGPYLAKGKMIAPRRGNQYGHLCVTLYRNEIKVKKYLHRLVAEAFLPPPEPGHEWVLHGERGVSCNHATNLRWGDQSSNERDKLVIPGKPTTRPKDVKDFPTQNSTEAHTTNNI